MALGPEEQRSWRCSSAVVFHDEGIVGRCKAYVSDLYNYCHQLTLEDVEHMHPLHIAA